jgi:hypothetical protein
VTRDHIKIVPSTTIKIMNDLAALDKRYMPEISPAVHDLIYNQSVAETNTPTIFPVQPPLSDMGTLAIIPDNPNPTVPLVFTDRLVPVTTATDDIIHHDKGGGSAAQVLPEQAMQHDIVDFDNKLVPVEPGVPGSTRTHRSLWINHWSVRTSRRSLRTN